MRVAAAVGRVGGLAIALGISAAVTGGTSVAWAAPEDSSPALSADATSDTQTPAAPTRHGRPSVRPAQAAQAGSDGTARRVADSRRPFSAPNLRAPDLGAPNLRKNTAPAAASALNPAPAAANLPSAPVERSAAVASAVVANATEPSAPAAPRPSAVAAVVPVAAVPTVPSSIPVMKPAAAAAVQSQPGVAAAVGSLLGPLFGANPGTPVESAVSWMALAAARRDPATATIATPAASAVATALPWTAKATAAKKVSSSSNKAPVISRVSLSGANPDTGAVTGTVSASDPNGDKITYKATTSSDKGTVTITTGGVFTYTPTATARHAAAKVGASSDTTNATVTVVVTDAKGASTTSNVSVPISPKNTGPVAGNSTVGTPDANTGVVVGSVLGSADPEGDSLTYSAPASTGKGNLTIDAGTGSFTYTPTASARNTAAGDAATNIDKTDTFTVTVSDGYGGSATIPVSVAISPKAGAATVPAASNVTFQFNYVDGAQYWTPQSQAALEQAANKVAAYIVAPNPVTIVYNVTGLNNKTRTLATATSDLTSAYAGFSSTVVQNKILTGVDANGSAPDGAITVNFGMPWSFTDTVSTSQYDFVSTTMHEFVHSMGFISFIDKPGSNTRQNWTKYDSFIMTANKVKVISTSTFRWNNSMNSYLTGSNGGLYFGGPNAVAAYGGLVPLYTPSTWASGSSINHLRDAVFSGVNSKLMNALVNTGIGTRALSNVEIGVLKDLGYTVVPVQASAALLVLSVLFLRRRRLN